MNKEDKIVKEIFETLIKYTNLTPDAIDDLYYLQGYIEEKDKEIERLNNIIDELEKYMNEERINNGQIDEWTIMEIQMKLKELKEGK